MFFTGNSTDSSCTNIVHIPTDIIINNAHIDNFTNEYNFTSDENIIKIYFDNNKADYKCLFYECTTINEIDFSNFDTSNVNNMRSMLKGCSSLASINFENFNTAQVTDMSSLFYNCSSLNNLNLSNFDTSNVKNMGFMFRDCLLLQSLDLSNFNTSNVANMGHFFYGCQSLTSINLYHFDASKVTNMCEMFSHCYNVTSIILPSFHSTKLLNMSYMFHLCYSLKTVNFFNVNTSFVTTIDGMFSECSNLTSINLNNFNTSKVIDMNNMFNQCKKLISLDLSNFNTSSVINMEYMFNHCENLISLNLSNFYTSNVNNMNHMFAFCQSLASINLTNFDASRVTDMCGMFAHCYNIKSIILPTFRTSQLEDINSMFYKCSSLESLDLSNFNTSLVTKIEKMFSECSNLTSINFNNFITWKVTNMNNMFNKCQKLISLNLNSFNTSLVTNMKYMFNECLKLSNLEISTFSTSNVKSMQGMFKNCMSLTSINLSKFNTSSATNMRYMFAYCHTLKSLNLSSFITSNVEDMSYMFAGISNITSLDLSFFNTSNVKNMEQMFYDSYNLKYLDLKSMIIPEDTNMTTFIVSNLTNPIICIDNNQSLNKIISLFEYHDEYYNITKKENISCNNECPLIKYNERCNIICSFYYFALNKNEHVCTPKLLNNSFPLCSREKPFLNYELLECVYFCTIRERQNKICITNYISNNKKDYYYIYDLIINQTRNELANNFNESLINGIPIKERELEIILTKTDNQGNATTLNLTLCEERLRDSYNITKNESLYLLRINTEQDGIKNPSYNYELYFPINNNNNIEKLNLSICKDIKIDIIIQANLTENLDKYNLKSGYYNDICYTADSDYGTDIILSDRKQEYFDNNYSICEIDCDFVSYNYETQKAVCSCEIKTEIPFMENVKFDKNILINTFTDISNIINFEIIFCYKTVFKKKSLLKNFGFFIYIALIILNLICLLNFMIKDFKKFSLDVNNIKPNILSFNDNNKKKVKRKNKNKKNDIAIIHSSKFNKNKNEKNYKNYPPKKRKKRKKNMDKISYKSKTGININDSKNKSALEFLDKKKESKNELVNLNYSELNSLKFEEAIITDKRNFIQYYKSLLKIKHIILFIFNKQDYNSQFIKISIFIFNLATYIIVNALFFIDSTMHKIYTDHGSYNFIYQLPQIIYSSLISTILKSLIKLLGLSESIIINFQNDKNNFNEKTRKLIKTLKIKFCLFYLFNFIFIIVFLYYITCFCGIYKNTQIHLIKDSLFSFCLSIITPFAIYLFPGIFRVTAIKKKNKYLYRFSKILQLL